MDESAKQWCLDQAIEIVESYGAGGHINVALDKTLEAVYNKLKELRQDVDKA